MYFNPLKVFLPLTAVLGGAHDSLVYDFFDARGPNGELALNLGDKTVLLFVATVQTLTVGLVADLIDKKSRLRSAHTPSPTPRPMKSLLRVPALWICALVPAAGVAATAPAPRRRRGRRDAS